MKKSTKETFIAKAKTIHGDRYSYDNVEYVNSVTIVEITCKEHGSFYQAPSNHLRGKGCPLCANKLRGRFKRDTKETFIRKAKEIHGDKYDYSNVDYVNQNKCVEIICKKHGSFIQLPASHLQGRGCPKCSGKGRTKEDVIKELTNVHNGKYDYNKLSFNKLNDKVIITCPIHGDFEQTLSKHLKGQGCPKCAVKKRNENQTLTQEEFIKRAENISNGKDTFENVSYSTMKDKVKVNCKKHGEYEIRPYDYLSGHRCPKCGTTLSNAENEIYEFICSHIDKSLIERHNRSVLNGKEIDIYIPTLHIGIEYNGLKWHSEEYDKDRYYHIDKMNKANEKGIRLIQIFEDEYIFKKDIVLNKLLHILKCDIHLPKVMARKCEIKEISKKETKEFLNKYHIQGYGHSSLCYGAFYNGELIGVMTFIKYEKDYYVLERFASNYNYICQGIGGKLFKRFVNDYKPQKVKSFADRRWSSNDNNTIYEKLGFTKTAYIRPSYTYVQSNKRIHKFNFRKSNLIKKYNLSTELTENEMTKQLGYFKVWDCGLIKYEWNV